MDPVAQIKTINANMRAGKSSEHSTTPPTAVPRPAATPAPRSAYSVTQWEQLEHDVFDGAGDALTQIREHARAKVLAPIPFLLLSAQRALTALPAHACFDAGLGRGSLNTFIMLVGKPGEGKDATAAGVREGLTVSHDGRELIVRDFGLGSGEGVVALLQEGPEGEPSEPVLFGASEIGQMSSLMDRKGATLRPSLLSVYSGNPLGFSNKNERTYVKANSYSAGVWIGCQPDKAGAVLDGPDDGLKHRFIWTEMLDPLTTLTVDTLPDIHPALRPVEVPASIMQGKPFTYHRDIVMETRQNSLDRVKFGMQHDAQGHRHQTRLKLAAGLALISSRARVSLDDWHRAGVLMDYSDAVLARCQAHLDQERVKEEADRLMLREDAEDSLTASRRAKARRLILDALATAEGNPVEWTPIHRRARRFREEFVAVAEELEFEGVIFSEEEHLDNGKVRRWVSPGPRYKASESR